MKPMIQAHLVERDQFGFWTHPNYPDLADNCSSNEAQETLRRLGLELQTVFMESDAPRLYDSARSDQRYSEWIPTRPEGSGWFVLSIHDTDNGPVCQYVRPLGEHLSPIDLDAAAEQHERLLSEACAKALNQRDAALARVASLESKLEELEKLEPAAPSDPKLKPCPLCGSTNIRMLEPELLDTNAWNCAIECLDCQVYIGPSYCEPDTVTARYSAQVDWNRRPSAK
ncbi:Lar family restriction alleviation protein, partial [Pseudomonas aeruginosa]